ncbi:MAG: tRNA dihydrouridine synthase DusB [Desulfatiglans sp.]|jgi:nifR3 family TIM-barrel protein|nr:tRNA dihydrouridine synthase DusB [Thermodesulfobacteriota bacterium]MEE4353741.1 tRNA dihydrouridine synthase DusB [Desulfatiglans sp.]
MFSIGNVKLKNRLVMAPMAGITNLPFRMIVKKMGAALVTTEMVSAAGLTKSKGKTFDYLKSDPLEHPLSVQIFGSDPHMMAGAAEIVVDKGADIVDINMGCPARKVVKNGSGGALLKTPEKAKEIITAVRRVCPVPMTVKIRAGWSPDRPTYVETARIAQDCGADAITVHPRFVSQGFSGRADWTIIAEIKEILAIPCIGNGDIFHAPLALDLRNRTGCDAVMIGRGAVGNPWIFRQIQDLEKGLPLKEPDPSERKALIMEHFGLLADIVGETRASKIMRGLLLQYTKGMPNSSRFRGIITHVKDLQSLTSAMDRFFSYSMGITT